MKELSQSQIKQIHERINAFIEEKGIEKKEGHIQTYFIVKVFEILGWTSKFSDINPHNEKATGKIPDIQLKNSKDETIFIIECKAGSKLENLNKTNKQGEKVYVNQLLKYCKDAGINWGVLTNFSEWQIYNTTTGKLYHNRKYELIKNGKANETDINDLFDMLLFENLKANNGKINTDPIYYATADDIKEDFFQKLKVWRADLRLYLQKSYSDKYSPIELDNQTQRILDRLIFISYCHKKKIISTDVLLSVLQASRKPFYEQLKIVFEDYNDKYNSDIFSEAICDKFKIDNEIIEPIISGINGVDFSQINVHIIGEVYENYLGELLKSSKSKPATDEIKEREKRKSHGIFYTPDYIVEYIVNNTIGEALKKCKTAKDVESLKIIDPACGSGSFLIKAFDVLYEKYVGFYRNKYGQLSAFAPLEISKKILTHNLFGVDLDDRAVEIAKLNLLLKALERIGDTQKTGRKILPNLSLNICVGNSLVSGKIEDDAIGDLFSSKSDYKSRLNALIAMKERFYHEDQSNEEMYRLLTEIKEREEEINNDFNEYLTANYFKKIDDIKPLNFEVKFCEIFKQGGFDCVIGNPPYGATLNEKSLTYLKENYSDIVVRMIDTYMYFMYRGFGVLKDNGKLGMIVPDVLLYQSDNIKLRKHILDNTNLTGIVNTGNVFDGVKRPTCIITYFKNGKTKFPIKILNIASNNIADKKTRINNDKEFDALSQSRILKLPNYIFITDNLSHYKILDKIYANSDKKLLDFVDEDGIQRGVSPDYKEAFIVTSEQVNKKKLEKSHIRNAIVGGKQVKRFNIDYQDLSLIYTRNSDDFKSIPHICNHINQYKSEITCKEVKENKHSLYALHRAREQKIFTKKEKVVGVITEDEIVVAIDNKKYFTTDGLYVFGVKNIDIEYLVSVLNSKLFIFIYRLISREAGKQMAQVKPTLLNELPIAASGNKDIKNRMIKLYAELIALNKLKRPDESKVSIKMRQIDSLVYKLYGITDEKEIEIIENAVK